MGGKVRAFRVVLCLAVSLSTFARGQSCREYIREVASEKAGQLSGWYNPLQKYFLRKKFETPVVKTLGEFNDRELDPELKQAIEFEIADLVEDYETKRNSKLSVKAKVAYLASAILGAGSLMATDYLEEPMRSVARLFILGVFTKLLNAASGPADVRVNGAVSSWVSKNPTVGTTGLPELLATDAKRISQQAPRVAQPVEQDGINKILDSVRTISILLSDADRWAAAGDELRAAKQVRDVVEIYVLYYSYLKKSEKRIRRKARTYLEARDRAFRDRVYQLFVDETDREVDLVHVGRVLDAWMPHTRMQRPTPWKLASTHIDTSGVPPAIVPEPPFMAAPEAPVKIERGSPKPTVPASESEPDEGADEEVVGAYVVSKVLRSLDAASSGG